MIRMRLEIPGVAGQPRVVYQNITLDQACAVLHEHGLTAAPGDIAAGASIPVRGGTITVERARP